MNNRVANKLSGKESGRNKLGRIRNWNKRLENWSRNKIDLCFVILVIRLRIKPIAHERIVYIKWTN